MGTGEGHRRKRDPDRTVSAALSRMRKALVLSLVGDASVASQLDCGGGCAFQAEVGGSPRLMLLQVVHTEKHVSVAQLLEMSVTSLRSLFTSNESSNE